MRVLILLPGHIVGGAERAAAQVAAAARTRGHEVVVGTSRPEALEFGLQEHQAARMAVSPASKWAIPLALAQVRRADAHVIYSYHRWTTWIAHQLLRAGGPPVVHHAQTMLPHKRWERWGNETVAVSEAMREHAIAGGASPANTIVIHNGAVPRDPPPRSPTSTPNLVFAGRLVQGKGVDHLLLALAGLPDVRVTIIGEGPARTDLEALAEELGISGRVSFAGWVPDPWPLFGDANIGVVPSDTYPEGLPLVACEMMMSGLPILASDIPGLREVADEDAARLVPPGDAGALLSAIAEMAAEDLSRLGERARIHALRNFDATDKASRIVDVLEHIAGNHA